MSFSCGVAERVAPAENILSQSIPIKKGIMKHTKKIAILIAILAMLMLLAACGKKELPVPTDLTVTEKHIATWTKVPDVSTYTIEITDLTNGAAPEEFQTRKASYSLAKLTDDTTYRIRVKAVSADGDKKDSPWSEPVDYEKKYDSGCVYTLTNGGTEYAINKSNNTKGVLKIEDTHLGKPITKIGKNAFKGNSRITQVEFGKNIVSIGESAFRNCSSLTLVSFPEGLKTIDVSAFQSCKALTTVVLPNSIETVGEAAFSQCRALTTVELGQGLKTVAEEMFKDAVALQSINIPDQVTSVAAYAFNGCKGLTALKLGAGLTDIGEAAFGNCELLKSVSFAENSQLKSIQNSAFAGCAALPAIQLPLGLESIATGAFYQATSLADVKLPETVKSIGAQAFNGTKLYNDAVAVNPSAIIYVDNWIVAATAELKASVETISAANLKENTCGIADGVFQKCPKLSSVTLPTGLKYVGKMSFYQNPILYRVIVEGSGLETIGANAFAESEKLQTLNLGNSLREIDSQAFAFCTMLTAANLPDTVTRIGSYAFYGTAFWDNPEQMPADSSYTQGVVYAGDWVLGINFEAGAALANGTVNLKEDIVGIAEYAFARSDEIQSVVGVENAVYIGRGAFYECENLTNISLSRNLKRIEAFTFYKCFSLYNLMSFPPRLECIDEAAFYKCEMLTKLDLTDTAVKDVGKYAFYGCINLGFVGLPQQMTTIREYTFHNCASIKSITLPDSIETLNTRAFGNCTSLERVVFGNGLKTVGPHAFRGCTALTELKLSDSVESIEKYAFYGCTALQSIHFGTGLKSIGDNAFVNDAALTSLYLPQNVTKIGKNAFKGCNGLKGVVLTSAVRDMAQHAFYGCKDATFYIASSADGEHWHNRWNSSFRPAIYGCTLSEDKMYVVSVTVTGENMKNFSEERIGTDPMRQGYSFGGWTTVQGGTAEEYSSAQLAELAAGTTVYAIWLPAAEPAPGETA